LTKVAAKDLISALEENIIEARITIWLIDKKPVVFHVGEQDDRESIFI